MLPKAIIANSAAQSSIAIFEMFRVLSRFAAWNVSDFCDLFGAGYFLNALWRLLGLILNHFEGMPGCVFFKTFIDIDSADCVNRAYIVFRGASTSSSNRPGPVVYPLRWNRGRNAERVAFR